MFIYIFNDGEIKTTDRLSIGDLEAADDGLIDILDIGNLDGPKIFHDGEWNEVERA